MKLIKLFLASSIVEFKNERLEFERFIRVLDKIYKTHGMELDLIVCEDLPKDLANVPAQERINEQIPDCNYFFMIVGKEAGEMTVEEFDIALRSMRESGVPKVYVYFYRLNMDDPKSQSPSVQKFVNRLNDDLRHYFSIFANIDTVKLDFLMELCRDFPSDVDFHFEDGQAVLQNEKVMALAHVPLYGNNTELAKLKEKKERLNERFARLCAEYAAHPDSAEVYKELVKTSEERTRIFDRFSELEKDMFSLYKEIRSGDSDLTWYEREARKQVELGNYEAAVTILRDVQREKELEQAVLFADTSLEKIKEHVRENQLLIKTLKTQKRIEENVNEIRRCYKESADLTLKYHLDNGLLNEYASFLVDTVGDFEEAVKLTEIMKEKVRYDDLTTLAGIYQLAGEAYLVNAHKLIEGREFYNKAVDLYDRLADSSKKYRKLVFCLVRVFKTYRITGFESYEKSHEIIVKLQEMLKEKRRYISRYYECLIYYSCSIFYGDKGQYNSPELAEQYALKAFDIADHDNNAMLATCCGNLGDLYRQQKRYDDAYEYYALEYDVTKQDYSHNSYNLIGIAGSAKSLSLICKDMHKYNEAIAYAEEALEKYKILAERNPLSYEYGLSQQLHNLGLLYENIFDYYKSEKACREAYERRKATLNRDDVYEFEVIYSCRALACILSEMDRYEEAEALFREAISLSEEYAKKDSANVTYVRSSKRQLARYCLSPMRRYDEAKAILTELIDSRRSSLQKISLDIDEDLATYLDDNAALLCTMDRAEEAVALQKESYSYYASKETNGKITVSDTIPLHNMAWVLVEAGHYEEAAPYLEKELEIRKELMQDNAEGMDYYLSSTYKLRLEYCLGVSAFSEGADCYTKALKGLERLAEVCPDAFASMIAELHLTYAKLLVKAGKYELAGDPCRKAIEYYTELDKKASAVYQKDLVDAYDAYVTVMRSGAAD